MIMICILNVYTSYDLPTSILESQKKKIIK